MQQKILYLFTRTPLHVGAGSSVGAIDQPIQRERHTRYPIIPGSSIKGVLRDHFTRRDDTSKESVDTLFGKEANGDDGGNAGHLSFGEAKLLAFPVRSAKGSFALATSVLALSRFARDSGLKHELPKEPEDMTCCASDKVTLCSNGESGVVLEEYRLKRDGDFPTEWKEVLSEVLKDSVLKAAKDRFVLLSDGDLSHFASNCCQVNQHVRIDHETGTAQDGGLFNEETVPSETLLYAPLTVLPRGSEENAVFTSLQKDQLVQFGGNGTTGLGFCTTKLSA